MNRRKFIKDGALFVPMIFVPRLIQAQSVATANGLASFIPPVTGGGGGGGCTPGYGNTGGTGNRTSLITVTPFWSGGTMLHTSGSTLVDGDTTSNVNWFAANFSLSTNPTLTFDFGSGKQALITEAKFYQSTSDTHGTWQWRGSNDGSSYTNIGSAFTLGGATIQTITALSGNASLYRYYQLQGISGNASDNPFIREMEFQICGLP